VASGKKRILVVGGGKMGEAIVAGWLAAVDEPAAALGGSDIEIVEPSADRRAQLEEAHGVVCVADVADVRTTPDVVVLAVKPQVMSGVLDGVSSCDSLAGGQDGPLFISIAAGIPTTTLEAGLLNGASVVRVMPNMPLAIGAGASGVCGGSNASPDQVDYVCRMFGCLGRAVIVDEADMDVVCALSGSGPAYVAAMIEALRDAAAAQGLDESLAEALALQTVLGTAKLIDETGASPAETRESICSPGGTTLAALDALYEAGLADMFDKAVAAAVRRSKELAAC